MSRIIRCSSVRQQGVHGHSFCWGMAWPDRGGKHQKISHRPTQNSALPTLLPADGRMLATLLRLNKPIISLICRHTNSIVRVRTTGPLMMDEHNAKVVALPSKKVVFFIFRRASNC